MLLLNNRDGENSMKNTENFMSVYSQEHLNLGSVYGKPAKAQGGFFKRVLVWLFF